MILSYKINFYDFFPILNIFTFESWFLDQLSSFLDQIFIFTIKYLYVRVFEVITQKVSILSGRAVILFFLYKWLERFFEIYRTTIFRAKIVVSKK